MKFHRTGFDPTRDARLVFRNARWNLLVLAAVFTAIPFVWWWIEAPRWVIVATALAALLVDMLLLRSWRRRGRPENWVLALDAFTAWVNLRDVEYHTAEPGDTIVEILLSDVRAARRVIERYKTPDSDGGKTQHRDELLELALDEIDAEQIKLAIADEARRKPAPGGCLGVTVRANRTGSPVAVREDRLRIKFSTNHYGLTPRLKVALAFLANHVTIEPDGETLQDDWRAMDNQTFDAFVTHLAASGHKIDAIKLLRLRHGISLSEAKERVDGMG